MDMLKKFVDVEISNITGNTNTTDLNTIMILAKHTVGTAVERFRVYSDAAAAKADGHAEKSYVYKALLCAFSQTRRPAQIVVASGLAAEAKVTDYINAFDAAQTFSQGWLWVVNDIRVAADQLKFAEAVQATEKMYAAGTSEAVAVDQSKATDIGSLVLGKNLTQTYCWFDIPDPDLVTYSATEIALLARCGGDVAGTVQFLLKPLIAVALPDAIVDTPTKQNTLEAKGYTFAGLFNGQVVSVGSGKVGNGEWIDIRLATAWIKTNIRQDLANLFTSVDKLGMSNDGAASVETVVRSVLLRGRDLGIIAKDSPISVTTPDVTQLTKQERSKRKLPRVRFKCRLEGAIIAAEVRGEVYE